MILYLDSSALIKNYIAESDSTLVKKSIREAESVFTHEIAYVEIIAAFSRLLREGALNMRGFKEVKKKFVSDWDYYSRLQVNPELILRAADAAEIFGLRGYDSLQLASAEHLLKNTQVPVFFGCFDENLNRAAAFLGLRCYDLER